VIYRSNYLPLNETDLETFKTLEIKTVYDLRTNSEREKSPDILSPDTNIMMVNIAGSKESDLPKGIATAEDMINFFNSSMANMAAHDKGTQLRFGVVINSLIYTDGVQLYHCTAGKDRTGWVTAVIQLLVGMKYDDVLQDYLLTNAYTADRVNATYQYMVSTQGEAAANIYRPVLDVREEFFKAQFDEVIKVYGSIDSYATEGLGLSDEDIEKLKEKMLVGYKSKSAS
jgi:protein-tyrosine phosphatase